VGSVVLTLVRQRDHWRVKMTWWKKTRYFGQFNSQSEAEKWIEEHRWLTDQREEPGVAEADDPEPNDCAQQDATHNE
jgi:hypothetical protein